MNLKGETPCIFKKLQDNPGVVTGWFMNASDFNDFNTTGERSSIDL